MPERVSSSNQLVLGLNSNTLVNLVWALVSVSESVFIKVFSKLRVCDMRREWNEAVLLLNSRRCVDRSRFRWG